VSRDHDQPPARIGLRHRFEWRANVGTPIVGYRSERGLPRIVPVLGVNVKVVGDRGGLREFAGWARAHPGKASVGVPAPASAPDFAVRMMAKTFGADFTPVPYRGEGPVVQDLVREADAAFAEMVTAAGFTIP